MIVLLAPALTWVKTRIEITSFAEKNCRVRAKPSRNRKCLKKKEGCL